jgi:hypothetical protein
MKSFQALAALSICAALVGCAATASDYMNTSAQQLCIDYLSYPSYNIHQRAREEALRIRGINCAPFALAANARIRANQHFENSSRALLNQRSYGSVSVYSPGTVCHFTREVPSGMNKICYYNCVGSGHAMTINVVQLCPLTIER